MAELDEEEVLDLVSCYDLVQVTLYASIKTEDLILGKVLLRVKLPANSCQEVLLSFWSSYRKWFQLAS